MLYRLPQSILSRLVLPLASAVKSDVRREAEFSMPRLAEKKESQEICFIPKGHYTDFLRKEGVLEEEGDFVDEEGRVLGRHRGLSHYTVGQRKGLGISSTGRLFVKRLDPETNTVVLSATASAGLTRIRLEEVVLQGATEEELSGGAEGLSCMLRYRSRRYPVQLERDGEGWVATVDAVNGAVTPGQSAVVYRGDVIAMGGVIAEAK